ncbi:hypothetical protein KA005_22865 [bacterium]|nr:hypothetical protein [bacterium]
MKVKADELLKTRPGLSGKYSCPVHIPNEACLALFREKGVDPDPKAVGILGDILENFALKVVGKYSGRRMSVRQLQSELKFVLGE